ncbi:MAG: KOW domain-containing RNA-binding protein [Lachnospiraceae bacterium]|nr:KOW domain-containing RNA-binding protein [Lachnospiraceae bacterium]
MKGLKGCLGLSTAGHDKGTVYLIIDEDDKRVYVADGKLKKAEAPKAKNKKHIQAAGSEAAEKLLRESGGKPKDEEIRKLLKEHRKMSVRTQEDGNV